MKRLLATAVLAIAALAGCASTPQSPAQKVYAAHGTYTVALTAAVNYKALPACEPTQKQIACKQPPVVKQLQEADDVAYTALSVAQRLVRGDASPMTVQQAVDTATRAVGAFAAIAQRLGERP